MIILESLLPLITSLLIPSPRFNKITILSNKHGAVYRWYDYVRINGNVINRKDRVELSLELIRRVEDFNEVTNHYLSVIAAKCSRKLGPLVIEDSKSEPTVQLTEQMRTVTSKYIKEVDSGYY